MNERDYQNQLCHCKIIIIIIIIAIIRLSLVYNALRIYVTLDYNFSLWLSHWLTMSKCVHFFAYLPIVGPVLRFTYEGRSQALAVESSSAKLQNQINIRSPFSIYVHILEAHLFSIFFFFRRLFFHIFERANRHSRNDDEKKNSTAITNNNYFMNCDKRINSLNIPHIVIGMCDGVCLVVINRRWILCGIFFFYICRNVY